MSVKGSHQPGAIAPDRRYVLVCTGCGTRLEDNGLILDCPGEHPPALLRTEYPDREFTIQEDSEGLFRYRSWLPVIREQPQAGRTIVYRSTKLSKELGLANLWIAFNGYWPERGAFLETATFKELEAHTVLARLPDQPLVLTVASSGNTAAAFAWACSEMRTPCLLVVPERGLGRFRFRTELDSCVHLVIIEEGDYPDAIELVNAVSRIAPFYVEGGARNVGRRDGLGTVLLAAFEEIGLLPEYYFQAVGSGTGAISALEAAVRVRGSSEDRSLPRLMMCQNSPFTPIYDAWRMGSNAPRPTSEDRFRDAIKQVHADELTNWTPPYTVIGGVYDALIQSQGDVLTADNVAVEAARDMFSDLEGIDIEPAAGVALACLRDFAAGGGMDEHAVVLLNVTGGGRLRLAERHQLIPAEPRVRLAREHLQAARILEKIPEIAGAGMLRRPEAS